MRQSLIDEGWLPGEFESDDEWSYRLTAEDLAEIDAALASVEAAGLAMGDVDEAAFPLPTLADRCLEWRLEIDQGRGFVLLRGLPVERYGPERSAMAFWGLGRHLGHPLPQNPAGDLLGHVLDEGGGDGDPTIRKYRTNHDIAFHVDGADLVGLLCLQPAAEGGYSRIASSVAVRQEIVWRRPDLAPLFEEPFYLDLRDEQADDEPPFLPLPLSYVSRGRRRIFYHHDYFFSSQRLEVVPRYTVAQTELLELFESLAHSSEFRLDMDLHPGDMQFIDNGTIVHARTRYVDSAAAAARRRHLLRLWLSVR